MSAEIAESNAESLLKELLSEIKKQNLSHVTDATLWSLHEIAAYIGLSAKYIQNHQLTSRKDFPRAVVIPVSQDGGPTRRWKAKEVVAWATRLRESV